MFVIHAYLDDEFKRLTLPHLPRCGDTMRFDDEKYGIIKEVVWCMDERDRYPPEYQRVNLRIEVENNKSNDE